MFLSSLLLVLVQFLFITSSYQFLQSIKFATRSVKNFQKKSFHFQENTKSNFYTSSYIRLELAVMYKQKSTEAYSELCQTSKIDCFPIFPKSSILHVLTCSEYVSSPVDCRHCYKQLYTLRKRQICCQSANFAEILQRNIFMHKYLHIFMQLEVFYKKGALENFAKFSGKHLCQSLFFNKVAGLRPVLQNSSGLVLFLIVSIFVYVLHVNVLT